MRESLGSLPTVRPGDIAWLEAVRPLLATPANSVSVCEAPSPTLEEWVAFFAAAVAFGADWGTRHGAVRTFAFELGCPLVVVAAFGRVAIVRAHPEPKVVRAALVAELSSATHYSLEWAAAAYAAKVLEAP